MRVLFRVNASASLGAGHVRRCLALADAMEGAGWRSVFACNHEAIGIVPELSIRNLLDISNDAGLPPASTDASCWDLAVVDHYGLGDEFEAALRGSAAKILAIDDLHDRRHDCDYLLDQTLGRGERDYDGLVAGECRMFLGPAYALLRPEFREERAASLRRREKPDGIKRICVQFGGTDPLDLSSLALKAAALLDEKPEIDVMLGAGSGNIEKVRKIAAETGSAVTVHAGHPRVSTVMAGCDLVLGAPGVSSWERCTLGLPSLLIPFAANQTESARALESHGAAVNVGWAKEATAEKIAGHLQALIQDPNRLHDMSRAAAGICDGRGVIRVLMALLSESGNAGGRVSLRFAEESDSQRIFVWQSAPGTRRYSRNPASPSHEEHGVWFNRALLDPSCYLMVIEHDAGPAGVLRLDAETEGFLISIYVAPDCYRRGIAKATLKLARRIWADAPLNAEVLPGNDASRALFHTAGFKPVSETLFRVEPAG